MGNLISGNMAEMQRKSMEKQQKTMVAMTMANSRDLCLWIGGTWAAVGTGLLLAGNRAPRVALVPFGVLSIVFAYNVDFAYGNKAERIRQEFLKIQNEDHWFTDNKK
eukprot:NODE_505_length_6682_cov_0.825394.p7 type:complete len:107 gc:universal NODE_505_length_6682_cov_0.825394:5658-5338(-)